MKEKIVVAPLNWGMGHAARCIPIIQGFLEKKIPVFLASDGAALLLLCAEFPMLPTLELPTYGVVYRFKNMTLNMLLAAPTMLRAIQKEHEIISQLVEKEQITTIISDNRYGCCHAKTNNIFVSHQLNILAKNPFARFFANQLQHYWLKSFHEIWVPDIADSEHNFSGKLSHPVPSGLPPVRYIGALSRVKKINETSIIYDVIAILSGPEPQRTYFEKLILKQMAVLPMHFLVVRGTFSADFVVQTPNNIEIVSFLSASDLNCAVSKSNIIVSRAGYSTIMDLAIWGKKAILVPTPSQTEQEYLAQYFESQKIFYTQTQNDFNLKIALEKVENYLAWAQK